jgi:hypothetical protein
VNGWVTSEGKITNVNHCCYTGNYEINIADLIDKITEATFSLHGRYTGSFHKNIYESQPMLIPTGRNYKEMIDVMEFMED